VTERATGRELLARYLRQRAELGQRELYLGCGTAAEMLGRLRAPRGRAATPRPPLPGVEAPRLREVARSDVEGSGDRFEALRAEVLGCTRCRLAEGRTTVVFGEGDRDADLLVVGEAPGYEEDRQGRPFVGPAGKLLDKMLAAIGFRRDEVFICNVLKCRPPQNRDPVADEVAACRPYLRQQVEVVAPKAICAFGRFAAQTLLASEVSLGRLRGATHEFMGIPVVVTYHPAALLRNQQWKRPAWEDLKLLRRIYDQAGGRPPGGSRG
jgi:uracil-DNA glycosylase family 4